MGVTPRNANYIFENQEEIQPIPMTCAGVLSRTVPENSNEPATRAGEQNISLAVSTRCTDCLKGVNCGPSVCTENNRLDCRRLDIRSELHVVGVILAGEPMYLGELCFEVMHVRFGKVFSHWQVLCAGHWEDMDSRGRRFVKLHYSDLVNSEELLWHSGFY